MGIVYKNSFSNAHYRGLDELTDSVGWGVRGEKAWQRIMELSSFCVTAWDDKRLIGMSRILEDGIMCMVYDVIVHPDYQGHGLGSEIMKRITDEIELSDFHSVGLFAWDGNPLNKSFYKKFGFTEVTTGMKRNIKE